MCFTLLDRVVIHLRASTRRRSDPAPDPDAPLVRTLPTNATSHAMAHTQHAHTRSLSAFLASNHIAATAYATPHLLGRATPVVCRPSFTVASRAAVSSGLDRYCAVQYERPAGSNKKSRHLARARWRTGGWATDWTHPSPSPPAPLPRHHRPPLRPRRLPSRPLAPHLLLRGQKRRLVSSLDEASENSGRAKWDRPTRTSRWQGRGWE